MNVLVVYPQTYEDKGAGEGVFNSLKAKGFNALSFDSRRATEMFGPEKMNALLKQKVRGNSISAAIFFDYTNFTTDTLVGLGCKKALWYFGDTLTEEVLKVIPLFDKFYYSCASLSSRLTDRGVSNSEQLLGACDDTVFKDYWGADDYYKSDVAFIGTVKGNRAEMCHQIVIDSVRNKYSFKIWGTPLSLTINGKPNMSPYVCDLLNNFHMHTVAYGTDFAKVATHSVIINWDNSPELIDSFSNKLFMMMGCKSMVITKYVKGLEKYFTKGKHIDWFDNISELKQLIKHYLANKDECMLIGSLAQKEVYSKHTYNIRVCKMLTDLGCAL